MRGSAQNAKSAKPWHSQSAIKLGVARAKSYSPPPPRRYGRSCTCQLSVPLILAKTFAKTRQESRRLHSLAQEFWVNVKGAHSPVTHLSRTNSLFNISFICNHPSLSINLQLVSFRQVLIDPTLRDTHRTLVELKQDPLHADLVSVSQSVSQLYSIATQWA